MPLLREALLIVSRNEQLRRVVESAPLSRDVVRRYIAGDETSDAVTTASRLVAEGLLVTLDFLGEDTVEPEQAEAVTSEYLAALDGLAERGLTAATEVSVKLSAIGQALAADGEQVALANARRICQAAANAGTVVTLDMEDHTTTDSTLRLLQELRQDFPATGAVLQSYLRRTEADCRDLAVEGSRVRLCKGAYREPETVAYQSAAEVDRSYVRCMKVLLSGRGYPMLATHDPRLVEIAGALATRFGREQGSYEYQMLLGVRPEEQRRLARRGEKVRVYVPYGHEWYGYMMRRMAERPANMVLFARSLISKD
jgi:proline dehydrogenase